VHRYDIITVKATVQVVRLKCFAKSLWR